MARVLFMKRVHVQIKVIATITQVPQSPGLGHHPHPHPLGCNLPFCLHVGGNSEEIVKWSICGWYCLWLLSGQYVVDGL